MPRNSPNVTAKQSEADKAESKRRSISLDPKELKHLMEALLGGQTSIKISIHPDTEHRIHPSIFVVVDGRAPATLSLQVLADRREDRGEVGVLTTLADFLSDIMKSEVKVPTSVAEKYRDEDAEEKERLERVHELTDRSSYS